MYKKQTSELIQTLKNITTFKSFKALHQEDLLDLSLSSYLEQMIEKSDQSAYKIINAAGLDLSYGYKILRGDHMPSRNTLIKLAFVLELDLTETQRLLKLGQVNELYPRSERDALIVFCLNQKMTLQDLEEALYQNQSDPLSP